jgi:hypothetical protein
VKAAGVCTVNGDDMECREARWAVTSANGLLYCPIKIAPSGQLANFRAKEVVRV